MGEILYVIAFFGNNDDYYENNTINTSNNDIKFILHLIFRVL